MDWILRKVFGWLTPIEQIWAGSADGDLPLADTHAVVSRRDRP